MAVAEPAPRAAELDLIIEGGRRADLLQALRELWAFRHTVLAFAERDVRLKYKQMVLGVAWAVIQPLAFMVTLQTPNSNSPFDVQHRCSDITHEWPTT